ncbi:hypothetical protein [Clostridium grantii]|uniref:Uncharacterized protein n=1 Tax=Clostridium grantii DSM 8605 TaxID=1121316 RepID=A0A1M5UJT2_9CLOT|nr:hypothetical protein [Clostridium grantii]SHH63181.1 hypothetical protein SAMN02745207_01772 [Clostridium grantii DSM 8605]
MEIKGQTHKKSKKNDGIKPADRNNKKGKNSSKYENHNGEPIE